MQRHQSRTTRSSDSTRQQSGISIHSRYIGNDTGHSWDRWVCSVCLSQLSSEVNLWLGHQQQKGCFCQPRPSTATLAVGRSNRIAMDALRCCQWLLLPFCSFPHACVGCVPEQHNHCHCAGVCGTVQLLLEMLLAFKQLLGHVLHSCCG